MSKARKLLEMFEGVDEADSDARKKARSVLDSDREFKKKTDEYIKYLTSTGPEAPGFEKTYSDYKKYVVKRAKELGLNIDSEGHFIKKS